MYDLSKLSRTEALALAQEIARMLGDAGPKTTAPTGKGSKLFRPNQVVSLLTTKNPKKPGSAGYDRFARYRDGMTVQEALEAGLWAADLRWDYNRGFIAIADRAEIKVAAPVVEICPASTQPKNWPGPDYRALVETPSWPEYGPVLVQGPLFHPGRQVGPSPLMQGVVEAPLALPAPSKKERKQARKAAARKAKATVMEAVA